MQRVKRAGAGFGSSRLLLEGEIEARHLATFGTITGAESTKEVAQPPS